MKAKHKNESRVKRDKFHQNSKAIVSKPYEVVT